MYYLKVLVKGIMQIQRPLKCNIFRSGKMNPPTAAKQITKFRYQTDYIIISRLVLVKHVFPTFSRNAKLSISQLKFS